METLELVAVYTFVLGSLYLLVSIGFSLTCGVLRIFHLGYGYIFVATAYLTWVFMKELDWGLWPAILGMVVIQAGIAIAAYKGIIKRWLNAEEKLLTGLLLIALIAEQLALYFYPVQAGVYLPTRISPGTVAIGSVVVSKQLIFTAVAAICLTALFVLFFLKSKVGLGIRALSQNVQVSSMLGVNTEKLYMLVMVLTVIPVIVAMLLVAPVWALDPEIGTYYFITAAMVVVLGGLGNLRGTLIAAYIIGFVHSFVAYIVGEPRLMHVSALALVLIVLAIRPRGIAESETLW